MGYINCLNALENAEVFILTATLLALVLLVWAQLSVPREREGLKGNFNLICGFVWTYSAIFFALIAVAVFVYNPTSACAKGFLSLSFFMTAFNIALAIGGIIVKLMRNMSVSEPVIEVESGRARIGWAAFWVFLLIGLGAISFGIAFRCPYCWGAGLVLFVIVIGIGACKWVQGVRKEHDEKKEKEPAKRDETWLLFYSCKSIKRSPKKRTRAGGK